MGSAPEGTLTDLSTAATQGWSRKARIKNKASGGAGATGHNSEWLTRKCRIDPRLDAPGWRRRPAVTPLREPYRAEEETENGPADDALWLDNQGPRR
jgi:hypothetical protein